MKVKLGKVKGDFVILYDKLCSTGAINELSIWQQTEGESLNTVISE
jgi:hypothetical protein